MTEYLFIFGRNPELSALELTVFFPKISIICPRAAIVSAEAFEPPKFISKLGGIYKIAGNIIKLNQVSAKNLSEYISQFIKDHGTFGISWYCAGNKVIRKLPLEIKEIFKTQGIKAGYAISRHGEELSSVLVEHQHIVEINIVYNLQKFFIGKTEAVQDYRNWSMRDYGRPYADAKSGMLPPKIARMAVNIALGPSAEGKTICDPFCGMGTILAEAALSGASCYGSDISADTVAKAQKNLEWLTGKYPELKSQKICFNVGDAVHLSSIMPQSSIDAIITEPFLGTARLGEGGIGKDKAVNIAKGIEKLIIGCLRNWHQVLKPKGKVFLALPSYHLNNRVIDVKKPIDTCEKLGYTYLSGPIAYAREKAVVIRNFYLLEKK